ncbi:MAG TPA: glycosyltransferase family 1 protein [Bryobacteraceae bacterium]|nr:glycosyltransferase family 1 protein [Bryobacteraceae bacterium]
MPTDLVCLSHLRWGFVYQRPQHLLSRFAKDQRVFFIEEPVTATGAPRMEVNKCSESGVYICVPQMPDGLGRASQDTILKLLLNNLLAEWQIKDYLLWYYTPMALSFSAHLRPRMTIFDCMDELSAFKDAPQEMKDREAELLRRADLVFTGGQSLFEAKFGRHHDLHVFPSSIEFGHFAQARTHRGEPADQAHIARPRIGFCGVIDERMDIQLLAEMAKLRPDYQFIMVGPVVKIEPADLPRHPNIHYLGGKSYKELPSYMAGWDAAMLPFAHNDSTRFISPTKTPEYLAAGKPVVSTSITDVVRPYGVQRMVRIADNAEDFIREIELALVRDANDADWKERVDNALAQNSWDLTYTRMRDLIESRIGSKTFEPAHSSIPSLATSLSVNALGD